MNNRFNASGCKDLTAHAAIDNITKENKALDRKAYKIINLVKDLLNFAGFDLLERIQIVDIGTGKEYR